MKADPACLAEALESWLTGPLDANPILLIIDDLERILETPTPSDTEAAVMVTAEYRVAMALCCWPLRKRRRNRGCC